MAINFIKLRNKVKNISQMKNHHIKTKCSHENARSQRVSFQFTRKFEIWPQVY